MSVRPARGRLPKHKTSHHLPNLGLLTLSTNGLLDNLRALTKRQRSFEVRQSFIESLLLGVDGSDHLPGVSIVRTQPSQFAEVP